MAFTSIQDQNPFVLPLVFLGLLLLARSILLARGGRARQLIKSLGPSYHYVLLATFLVALIGAPVFEAYFTVYECSVSDRYYAEVLQTTRATIAALSAGGVSYWLDYATLLAALRRQSINPWDHDADLSILHPDYTRDSPQEWHLASQPPTDAAANRTASPQLARLLDLLQRHRLHPTYDAKRHLLQTRLAPTAPPHCDIWLWQTSVHPTTGDAYLWTADHTVHYNPRRWHDVMPLNNLTWLGVPGVLVPHDTHTISSKEFSVYGGSYLLSTVFRGDCLHNFFNLRWLY